MINQLGSKVIVYFFLSVVWASYFSPYFVYAQSSQSAERGSVKGGPEFVDIGMGSPYGFHQVDSALLICAEKGLYQWNDRLEGTPEPVDTSMAGVGIFHQIGNSLLIGVKNGLYRWNDRLDGKPVLVDAQMGAIYSFHKMDGTLLIGAAAGLYRWDDKLEGKPVPVNTELGAVTHLHQMGSTILVGSTRGVYQWNDRLDGKPELKDLQMHSIYRFYPMGDALLVGAESGLYRWNDKLEGTPKLVDTPMEGIDVFYKMDSTLLIGGRKGLYRWNDKLEGKPVPIDTQMRIIYSFHKMGSTLLIGVKGGLYRWNKEFDGRPELVDAQMGNVGGLYQMDNTILVGTAAADRRRDRPTSNERSTIVTGAAVGLYRWNDKLEGKPEFKDPQIDSIYRYHPVGNALLVGAESGLYRWNVRLEGKPEPVDVQIGTVVLFFQMDSTILIGATSGLYRWDDKLEGKPEPVSAHIKSPYSLYKMGSTLLIGVVGGMYRWNDRLDGEPEFIDAVIGTAYSFYRVGSTLLIGADRGLYRWNDRLDGHPELVDSQMGGIYQFYPIGSTIMIGAPGGLYRWDDKLNGKPVLVESEMGFVSRFHPVGSVLLVGAQSGVFKIEGVGLKWNANIEVNPLPKKILSDNKVTVTWTINNYERRANPNNVQMRIILKDKNGDIVTKNADGNSITDDQWIVTQGQHQITIPNLSSGNYILIVQATDLMGNHSESKPIDFKVYSSLEEYFTDWGKLLALLYAVITIIVFLILVLGARRSKRCFDILTDPLTRKLGVYFGFAVRYIRPVRIWVLERYFDELKKDWSGNNLYVPYHLILPDDKFDGASVDPIESTEIIKRLNNETRILILGGPGTGKSALVRNLMHTYCQEASLHAAWKKYGFIPILVRLRELAGSQTVKISELARSALDGKEMTFHKDDSFFESLLRNSDFLIVLDGLNEVNIERAVDEFAVTHYSVRLLTTSQTDSISDSFKRYRLPFFDPEFAKTLLRNFIGDEPAEKAIKEVPELWKEIKCGYDVKLVEHLVGRAKTNGQRTIASCRENTILPKNRVELYNAMIEFSKQMYEQSAIQMKAFPYVRICEHAWDMWKNGQYIFQPDEGLAQPEIEHLVKTNLALKRSHGYEFMHSLMRDFLSAEFCTRHSGPTKLMIKTRIEGEEAAKVWKLPPDDQAPVFSFLAESIDQREDLQEIFQFASEKIKERHQLMIAAQEVAKKKGWQIQVNINTEL
jgi:hypothetical protein